MGKMDEMILAVPRKALFGADDEKVFQGFISEPTSLLKGLTYEVLRRGDLEENPKYKQLITYVVVEAVAEKKVLVYQRIGNGDARLHLNSSIGVGGHANDVDNVEGINECMVENALRELFEEIHIKDHDSITLHRLGYINDDSNDVGKVHVGVVYKVTVPSVADVEVAETDTLSMAWETKEQLLANETLENWSKILVPHI